MIGACEIMFGGAMCLLVVWGRNSEWLAKLCFFSLIGGDEFHGYSRLVTGAINSCCTLDHPFIEHYLCNSQLTQF